MCARANKFEIRCTNTVRSSPFYYVHHHVTAQHTTSTVYFCCQPFIYWCWKCVCSLNQMRVTPLSPLLSLPKKERKWTKNIADRSCLSQARTLYWVRKMTFAKIVATRSMRFFLLSPSHSLTSVRHSFRRFAVEIVFFSLEISDRLAEWMQCFDETDRFA